MKKILLLCCAVVFAATAGSASSKRISSIVETEPGEENSVTRFLYDGSGRLYRVIEGVYSQDVYTIDYSDLADSRLKFMHDNTSYGISRSFDITLDATGKAVSAVCSQAEGNIDMTFTYDGNLLKAYTLKSADENLETIMTYTGGNVTSIEERYSEDPDENMTFALGYTGTANRGALRFMEWFYGLDMMGLGYVAEAGYMGDAPEYLPGEVTGEDADGLQQRVTLSWTMDGDGYPVRLVPEGDATGEQIEFEWENTAGADAVGTTGCPEEYYGIDGVRVENPGKGIYIVRGADGKMGKRVVR